MVFPESANDLKKSLLAARQRAAELGAGFGTPEAMTERIVSFMTEGQLGPGYTCLTGWRSVFVREDGAVLPCWNLPEVGYLTEGGLATIWHSPGYAASRDRMARLDCRRCVLACHDSDFVARVSPVGG